MTNNTWVLVADGARARLFAIAGTDLTEVADFSNPEGRIAERELRTDRLPRVQESANTAHHAIEPHTSLQEKSAQRFARKLGDELERGRTEHRYDQLVLVAAPRFLGALHGVMDKPLRECVVAEVRHNLTSLPAHKLGERLPQGLFG